MYKRQRKAGHFVIVRVGEKGERMPLTIAGADPVKGTITLVVQEVGLSSTRPVSYTHLDVYKRQASLSAFVMYWNAMGIRASVMKP